MFRSSRPDYIETGQTVAIIGPNGSGLFRSSRPDYIETTGSARSSFTAGSNCSGLPDRTTLRPVSQRATNSFALYCSGLPDRTTLRLNTSQEAVYKSLALFRSSRPDYIETGRLPVFGLGLCALFRSSRPDYIETEWVYDKHRGQIALLFRSSRPDYIETTASA